jgi:hypothetical protein
MGPEGEKDEIVRAVVGLRVGKGDGGLRGGEARDGGATGRAPHRAIISAGF